jgi:hypothetical protein
VPQLFLLEKAYGKGSLTAFGTYLRRICGDLKVSFADLRVMENDWVAVQVSGPDERVAVHLLEREVGLAPVSASDVERFSVHRGKVSSSGASRTEIFVDVGVFSPKPVFARIPLRTLQAQLADGGKLALRSLVERFTLLDNFPLEVRVTDVSDIAFNAELTERQVQVFDRWTQTRLDRVVILGALASEAIRAVKQARVERDILRVESLAFLEHAIVCKLGTDGVGLVPRLGRRLRGAVLSVFSPRSMLPFSD